MDVLDFWTKRNDLIGPCATVVMPVYNEALTVDQSIAATLAQRPVQELIVVDDASTDGTLAKLEGWKARDSRVQLLRHDRNRGKGAALRTAFAKAAAPYVIIQDADLEYDPSEFWRLLLPLVEGHADVVFGSRFAGGPHRVLYYWHSVANKMLTTFSNMVTDLCLTDIETCYKAFRRDALAEIELREDRFGFEPEITAKIARRGLRVYEVPISYHGRTYAQGKKIRWRDGVIALGCIVKYGVFRR